VEYEENEHVRLACRRNAALAHLLINRVEGWFTTMENVPQDKKLTLFLDYHVQQ
jgi:hypothetical protein